MVTLAEAFAATKQNPPPPTLPNLSRDNNSLPMSPGLRTPPVGPPPPPSPQVNVSTLGEAMNNMHIESDNALPYPVCWGMYNEFNFTTRKDSDRVLLRIIVHNAVEHDDVQFKWISPRKVEIRIAWPDWFRFAEQMAMFTTDDNGQALFGARHPITMDTARRNERLVDGDTGRIWDQGYFSFQQDMLTDQVAFELLNVTIPSKGTEVKVLQFFCE